MEKTGLNKTFEEKVQEMQDNYDKFEAEQKRKFQRDMKMMRKVISLLQTEPMKTGEAVRILEAAIDVLQKNADIKSVSIKEVGYPF